MPSFTIAAVAGATLAFLANTASGHLTMSNPVPFGKDSLDNSPLEDAFPGNYPCKQRAGVYDITTMNDMKVGEPQQLTFEGSASHGGGSCQLAVSLDTEPTPDSTFKIIQVFEGGCPVSSDGNTGTNDFTFKIPEGFPNGQATFAWYWNNKIGNREAYMNCAPITVSGGSDNVDYYNSLPGLFLANLPSSDCKSAEGTSVEIPNPGEFIKKDASANIAAPSGPQCAAYAAKQIDGAQGSSGGGSGGQAQESAPASQPAGGYGGGAPAATSAPAAAPSGGSGASGGSPPASSAQNPGMDGGYSPPAADGSAAPTSLLTAISSPAAAAPTSPPATEAPLPYGQPDASGGAPSVAAPSGAAAPSTGGSSTGGSCSSSSGGISCSPDGSKFGMCTAGGELIWQVVASGTKCQNGGIVKRGDPVKSNFRNPHVRRHVRRAAAHKRYDF